MSRIHDITLKSRNKIRESKLNFFADYFVFATDNIGLLDDLPLENHLSVVEKIITQIEDNLEHSILYLDNHLSSPFLKDDLSQEFPSYDRLQNHLIEYFKQDRITPKINWLRQNKDFVLTLNRFKSELEAGLFRNALDAIKSFMSCPHELENHIHNIKYYICIIISEYLFKGFSKKEIKSFLNSTFSKNKNSFLFPETIKTPEEKSTYLEKVTLEEQLDAFWRAFNKNTYERNFLFRIKNVKANSDSSFEYNKVTFLSSHHYKIKALKKEMEAEPYSDMIKRFFCADEEIALATVCIKFVSFDNALEKAKDIIKKQLIYLNQMTEANATLDPFEYITLSPSFTLDGWSIKLDKKSDDVCLDNHIRKLGNSPYEILKEIDSTAKDHLLKFEDTYAQAVSTKSHSHYWQYLENLIQSSLPRKAKNDVRSYVSNILLLRCMNYHQNLILKYVLNAILPINSPAELIGLDNKRQFEIYKNWDKQNLRSINQEISNDFINHIIEKYKNNHDLHSTRSYYDSILLETSEQRNFYIHQGSENTKAAIKLRATLPKMIVRFRWLLFREIMDHPNSSFDEIINSLKEKGEESIQSLASR